MQKMSSDRSHNLNLPVSATDSDPKTSQSVLYHQLRDYEQPVSSLLHTCMLRPVFMHGLCRYETAYASRTGERTDGCLTFWRTQRFVAKAVDTVFMVDHGLKDNVALLVRHLLGGDCMMHSELHC